MTMQRETIVQRDHNNYIFQFHGRKQRLEFVTLLFVIKDAYKQNY